MDSIGDVSTGDETKHESITISSTHQSISGKDYQWRMRHYFYIHVCLFIVNGLLGGLAVLVIESYLEPNRLMRVHFIDTWFMSASCVYGCGLTTLDFARLSTYSQVILMLFTLASGITISTLPALVIKARTHKRESGPRVDDDHSASRLQSNFEKKIPCSLEAETRIAYLSCLFLIPFTCLTIYIGAFLCIGAWIQTQYSPGYLRQDGRPINPWYASFIITVTGFNQNGLTPWSDSLMRFVHDSVLNVFVMLVSENYSLCAIEIRGEFR
jgi:Trk-type K+ transport system membrane component